MVRVIYSNLAKAIRALSTDATRADLCAVVGQNLDYCPEHRDGMLALLSGRPSTEHWMEGLFEVCEYLQRINPRFEAAIFVDDLVLYDR